MKEFVESKLSPLLPVLETEERLKEFLISFLNSNGHEKDNCLLLLKTIKRLNLDYSYRIAALICLIDCPLDDWFEKNSTLFTDSLTIAKKLKTNFTFEPNLQQDEQVELYLKMVLSQTKDVKLLLSYIALRLVFMEQLKKRKKESVRFEAEKTIKLYAQLAERLGVFWIKAELEDASLRFIAPEVYASLKQLVAQKKDYRSTLVTKIAKEIEVMMQHVLIKCSVQGRYKRFFSIYKKMEKVNNNFQKIQDLVAFRVLCESVEDCYKALSYIHENWEPVPGRFKDYISKPKVNGYQSLHTTVRHSDAEVFEIQIRTHQMHHIAEFGVAAHWIYKQVSQHTSNTEFFSKYLERVKKNNQIDTGTSEVDPKQKIYVYTPRGDILELSHGSTAIDFAYAIHTELGNHIVSATANGKILKLDAPLRSGDKIDIQTSNKQSPNKEWLNFVQSTKAKAKIRHAIHNQERAFFRSQGLDLIEKEFKKNDLNLNKMVKEGKFDKFLQEKKLQNIDLLWLSLGEGSTKVNEVINHFTEDYNIQPLKKNNSPQKVETKKETIKSISMKSVQGIPIRFAKCCDPEEGSLIVGYITQGQGISIHSADCSTLENMSQERKIILQWSEKE